MFAERHISPLLQMNRISKGHLRGFGDSGNINTNTWNFKYIVGRSKYEKMSTSPFALSVGFQHESSFSYISNLSFKV